MLIDWFTVGAQALNFLVLVWLLKRFLYQPVLDAISARERRIAMQLADATAKEAAATKEREEFDRRNSEFDAQRIALLAKATEQAQAEHQRLLELARTDADALRSRLQDALRNEQQALAVQITRRTRAEVFSLARKTLADLATTSLEESMVRVFIERMGSLSVADKTLLASAIEAAPAAVIVRSAFELAAPQRTAIGQAIADLGGAAVQLSYQTEPGLISGVELSAGGRRLAWSIADYLLVLEKTVDDILQSQSTPGPIPGAKPASVPVGAPAVPIALPGGSG